MLPLQKRYLIGKRYEPEKASIGAPVGNANASKTMVADGNHCFEPESKSTFCNGCNGTNLIPLHGKRLSYRLFNGSNGCNGIKQETHMNYWTCPLCGANLDPWERCDCQQQEGPFESTGDNTPTAAFLSVLRIYDE